MMSRKGPWEDTFSPSFVRARETSGYEADSNRPLALRGHVTSASFKQLVGILLMPKIDRAHKNYRTFEI